MNDSAVSPDFNVARIAFVVMMAIGTLAFLAGHVL
jgi:hypothetical protein